MKSGITHHPSRTTFRIGVISDTHNLFDPKVPKLLAGVDHILHTGKCPWHFVGGRDGDPTVSNALHEIEHEECETVAKRFLLVRVRLFANLGAPGYVVVTGELPSRWAKDL